MRISRKSAGAVSAAAAAAAAAAVVPLVLASAGCKNGGPGGLFKRARAASVANTWQPVLTWEDPTKELIARFRRENSEPDSRFKPTGMTRLDYIALITSEVDFWRGHQNGSGAIIDPYTRAEVQYSTPAFAHAAALLTAQGNRPDLLEPAARAMDWATFSLKERRGANGHEDFYAPMLAHALPLLKPLVTPDRAKMWEKQISSFDPYKTYRRAPGSNNWNMVALSGEALFQQMGLRSTADGFVEDSLAGQGQTFSSRYGLYIEGPMPYDHFPRLWTADLIAHGYSGKYSAELGEMLRRAAITSLFMQSPWGELPAGGRSAHHQWNEAEQCVTYEIYASKAAKAGDTELAGIFKRAAHLSLRSMKRWVRPTGEMQIVKNWVDPEKRHAYEGYSSHSQYNLLPMCMLAMAFENAKDSESVAEQAAPADRGGFVLPIAPLHKVFANVGGTYLEMDTSADHHYDATGLIRVHHARVSPQLGPSDSVLGHANYKQTGRSLPTPPTGIGVSWKDGRGRWRRIGELSGGDMDGPPTVTVSEQTPARVAFDVTYAGRLFGVKKIIEHYVVTPGKVVQTTEIPGYRGPLKVIWPVLANDGAKQTRISTKENRVTVAEATGGTGGTAQTFTAAGASSVTVEPGTYANHNGWARLAVATYPPGARKTSLTIAPDTAAAPGTAAAPSTAAGAAKPR